ncbi:hypothetical protein [Psychroserpens luteolus]|uniref:hypothetical protein n=1 Tax=Psychroserpens luteolus TaxID=2855840 RepID=UPI001E5BC554|nr:hypothetical protein [Psychroserpens luteolus]MCD2259133.1 hypothetical protein [Psychroserpens luteolus]
MKRNFLILTIVIISISSIHFSFKSNDCEDKDIIKYFVNPDLDKTNYRLFESKNTILPKVLFKQIIKKNTDSDGINMEYYFMTPDSIPYYGGIENISFDTVKILEQYIYLDNRKIKAHKITGEIWKPYLEAPKTITNEFFDKESGLGIKSISQTFVSFKDTLNTKSFMIEFKSKAIMYRDGEKFNEIYSNTKRLYLKNKGLVYYKETVDNEDSDYYLVKNY